MKKQSDKDIAYDIIREKIASCTLQPGDIVDKNLLMEEIGVGITPIREATAKLEQDGLVVIMPRRGVVVSNISINDIRNIYFLREIIEPSMAREALPNVERKELMRFLDLFKAYNKKDMLEQVIIDSNFHRYIAEKTYNKFLVKLMDNIYLQNQRIRILTSKVPNRLQDSNREHIDIIQMFLDKDAEGVEHAMRQHMANAKNASAQIM